MFQNCSKLTQFDMAVNLEMAVEIYTRNVGSKFQNFSNYCIKFRWDSNNFSRNIEYAGNDCRGIEIDIHFLIHQCESNWPSGVLHTIE